MKPSEYANLVSAWVNQGEKYNTRYREIFLIFRNYMRYVLQMWLIHTDIHKKFGRLHENGSPNKKRQGL